jgi:hypothetical protein
MAYRGAGNGGDDHSLVIRGLADRIEWHFPDQSFRAVLIASGRQQSLRSRAADAAFPDAAVLQVRAAPDLSGLCHSILGSSHYERWAFVVRRNDHGLHLRWHFP